MTVIVPRFATLRRLGQALAGLLRRAPARKPAKRPIRPQPGQKAAPEPASEPAAEPEQELPEGKAPTPPRDSLKAEWVQ